MIRRNVYNQRDSGRGRAEKISNISWFAFFAHKTLLFGGSPGFCEVLLINSVWVLLLVSAIKMEGKTYAIELQLINNKIF